MIEIKRIAESTLTKKDALSFYNNDNLPQGWYLHGRNNTSIKTGRQLEFTRNWGTAMFYATDSGYVFLVKPKDSEIYDLSVHSTKLVNKILEDYEDYNLPYSLQELTDEILNRSNNRKEAVEMFTDAINPLDIVDTAEFWDAIDGGAIEWLYNTTDKTFFVTKYNDAIDISGDIYQTAEQILIVSVQELIKSI